MSHRRKCPRTCCPRFLGIFYRRRQAKVDPGFWAVPDGKRTKVRGGGLLLWDYVRYVKLTALYVQYVRAMECRRVGRDEIRAPQHQLAADTIAELHAVDRDPAATWSEYERWLTMRPPGR